jgi:KDO2-lipid IV(A) lauroyltransferase
MEMRHLLEYLIVSKVRVLVWLLPRRLVLAGGAAVGWMFYVLDAPRRRLALANLTAAFPVRPLRERRAIARATYTNVGRHLLDLIKVSSMPRDRLMSLVEFEGADVVEQAYARGRGVIFYSGHFGVWELQVMAHAYRFEPLAMVSRTLDNPRLDALLERVRTRCGTRMIYRRGAIRQILRELAARRGVGMMIDQHLHHSSAIYVDFFNRPAATTSAIALLALRTGAPVVPIFSLPLPGGRYRMVYEPAVEPPRTEGPEAVREFTERCTDVLESYVRRDPQLWLWMHRRWRDTKSTVD